MKSSAQIKEFVDTFNDYTPRILCVDDEIDNLDILCFYFKKNNFEVERCTNGLEALERLSDNTLPRFDVILLDRMMPHIDGMQVLKKIKSDPLLCDIPVIFQTGVMGEEEAINGINNGAYYYLCKPYEGEMALALARAALKDYRQKKILNQWSGINEFVKGIMKRAFFQFQTMEEAMYLSYYLSEFAADIDERQKYYTGLSAIMLNSVEHGNLEVGLDDKSEFLFENRYNEEIIRRLSMKSYCDRLVDVDVVVVDKDVFITIKDQGKGFNWHNYLDFDPKRVKEPNGRGIPLANLICGNSFRYLGNGSIVQFCVKRS